MGLSLGKKSYSAAVTITIMAYDKTGQVVWKDSTVKKADPGDERAVIVIDTSAFTGADIEKLHPGAIKRGVEAISILMARFDDTIAGKKVSSVQYMED